MSNAEHERWITIAKMYRLATKTYTLLPYYFARNGYAFPAWHYYFEVTRRCNLRCAMCQYIHWLSDTPVSVQKEGELTTDEWFRVIDQVRRWALVTFTGGEPFLRDDFLDLLERASRRTRTHFISNAVLLDEERARRCVELAPKKAGGIGLNFAGVSIEGPADVHDGIRKMRGAFERSTTGIKTLAALRNQGGKQCPMIHVTSVIQEGNVDCLCEMPRIVADMGANVLNLTLEVRNFELEGLGVKDPATYGSEALSYPKIDPARVETALRKTRIAAERAKIELRMPDMPDEIIVRYYSEEMDLRAFRCGGIWSTVIVGAKGDVYPCWLMKVGNVREQGLNALWNGPEFRAFRRRTRQGLYGPCAGCCHLSHRGR